MNKIDELKNAKAQAEAELKEVVAKLSKVTKLLEEEKRQAELKANYATIEKAITEKAMKIWTRDSYPYSPDNVTARVTKYGKEVAVEIDISREYQSPEIKFSDLLALSQYFGGTERIGEVNDWAQSGCETCDYGSSYGFTVRVLPKVEGGTIEIPSLGIEVK